ncbi:cytochrome c oxidase assembly protein [Dactylosporangium sp. CS-047395]|uniref:cytochrome c oxidase assembly protein n=1 Tax=Dactylosporangium sp. CS-047395 TaxID=3239936 RepID=UPI003D8EF41E
MNHTHAGTLPLLVVAAAVGYETLALLTGPSRRTLVFLAGCTLVVAGLDPAVSPWPAGDLRTHMLQHLLTGMLGPLALVLGAPVTLLLRTLPRRGARSLGRMLRAGPVRAVADPWVALALSTGGLVVLYCTPLYAAAAADPGLHGLLHVHFLLSGYLFAWVVAGPDPGPHRPPVPMRLVVLGVAVAVHASLAQLMYAGILVDLPVPDAERRGAAELMYYAGDIAELLVAGALVASWRPVPRRAAGVVKLPR